MALSAYDETSNLPVADILILEQNYLQCKRIDFNGILEKIKTTNGISTAVRRNVGTHKYRLFMVATTLIGAGIIGYVHCTLYCN